MNRNQHKMLSDNAHYFIKVKYKIVNLSYNLICKSR